MDLAGNDFPRAASFSSERASVTTKVSLNRQTTLMVHHDRKTFSLSRMAFTSRVTFRVVLLVKRYIELAPCSGFLRLSLKLFVHCVAD